MYDKTCEIIYNLLSQRIKTRRDALGLSNKSVCPPADSNLMSAIVNNRRDNKKNKYLIPEGIKNTYNSQNNIPFIEIIASNLGYKNACELLVGTPEEQHAYLGNIFYQIILDALETESDSTINNIESILSDYIPYAKASAFFDIADNHDELATYIIGYSNEELIENAIIERKNAIARLYTLFEDKFQTSYYQFFKNVPSTVKLNKRLSHYLNNILLPEIKSSQSNNPFISDAKKIISEYYEFIIEYEGHRLYISPEAIQYYEDNNTYYTTENVLKALQAKIDYIDSLSNIQIDTEGTPDINKLDNNWYPELCIT